MCTDHEVTTDNATPAEKWKVVSKSFEHEHGRPVVKAYRSPRKASVWIIVCPFCARFHFHGAADGSRVRHCASRTYGLPEYSLRYAGPLPDDLKPLLARKRRLQPYSFVGTPYEVEVVDPPKHDFRGMPYPRPLKDWPDTFQSVRKAPAKRAGKAKPRKKALETA